MRDFSPKWDELTHINSPLVNATIWYLFNVCLKIISSKLQKKSLE